MAMASAAPANASSPLVQHSFDGDVRILNATSEPRLELRKALSALARDLSAIEGNATQVKADIQLNVAGPSPRQHVYHVTVTNGGFDIEHFTRSPPSRPNEASRTPTVRSASLLSTVDGLGENGPSTAHGPPNPTQTADGRHRQTDDEIIEMRPFKRPRPTLEVHSGTARLSEPPAASRTPPASTTAIANSAMASNANVDDLFAYIRNWHNEWTQQGGWLFDNIGKAPAASTETRMALEQRLNEVQDVLGQSLNSAIAATMLELDKISKSFPWLEHCRKSNDDKVQAREEKWRVSSASFHDEARREREAAEARIEKDLAKQRALLLRIAKASGVGTEGFEDGMDENAGAASHQTSREASLGAQLTRELNMEAAKHDSSRHAGGQLRAPT